ncbi:MAG: DNA polymerase IV, partial [Clostridia bacterium]|nr:DNA polymerase IV [Clostridia bacterium]
IVVPPDFGAYSLFSRKVREIYFRYTDLVEPFGLDECWLDVTASTKCFGSPLEIAHEIRQGVKKELGLTVSVGVSFNKVFAKLGSDLKKPDAVTEITRENFRSLVWPLPLSDLLYAGRAVTEKLGNIGVRTIGAFAQLQKDFISKLLGKNGEMLWDYANGYDSSPVMHKDTKIPAKSVSHGITCAKNLTSAEAVRSVMLGLCQDIAPRLRAENQLAEGVQIEIKDCHLAVKQWSAMLPYATDSRRILADAAFALFEKNYRFHAPVRAVSVRATRLVEKGMGEQMDLLTDYGKREKLDKLESAMDEITGRFGRSAILPAAVLSQKDAANTEEKENILPHSIK